MIRLACENAAIKKLDIGWPWKSGVFFFLLFRPHGGMQRQLNLTLSLITACLINWVLSPSSIQPTPYLPKAYSESGRLAVKGEVSAQITQNSIRPKTEVVVGTLFHSAIWLSNSPRGKIRYIFDNSCFLYWHRYLLGSPPRDTWHLTTQQRQRYTNS